MEHYKELFICNRFVAALKNFDKNNYIYSVGEKYCITFEKMIKCANDIFYFYVLCLIN